MVMRIRGMAGPGIAIAIGLALLTGTGCAGGLTMTPGDAVPRPANAAPGALGRACAQAARRVGFAIACPSRLPSGSAPFWGNGFGRGECDPGACGPQLRPRRTWVGWYFPIAGGVGHVIVMSVPTRVAPSRFVYLVGTVTPHLSRHVAVVAETRVRGQRAVEVRPSLVAALDPPPRTGGVLFLGRVVLLWTEHGRTYAIGVGGVDHPRTVETAVARGLRMIGS